MTDQAPEAVQTFISQLPSFLEPLKERAKKHLSTAATYSNGVYTLAPVQWYGYQTSLFYLYASAEERWIQSFEERNRIAIPQFYRNVLRVMNGCSFLDIHLYGLPPSMQGDPPLLDRSQNQPLDLGAANTTWKANFLLSDGMFLFGTRPHREGKAGYFWHPRREKIRVRPRCGFRLGEWDSLDSFLVAELAAAEERFRRLEAAGISPQPSPPSGK